MDDESQRSRTTASASLALTSQKGHAVVAPTKTRASRVREINRMLQRWETPDRLTWIDHDVLLATEPLRLTWTEPEVVVARGFAHELEPTRKRAAKISAKAKVVLLLWELDYRYWEAHMPLLLSEEPSLHLLLLHAGHRETDPSVKACYGRGAGLLYGDDKREWRKWSHRHRRRVDSLLGAVDDAIETKRVLRTGRERHVLGERKRIQERFERLRAELGEPFINGTIDREAQVRQWVRRLRLSSASLEVRILPRRHGCDRPR
jgi:hypothetical protein